MGRKLGGRSVPFLGRGAVSPYNTKSPVPTPTSIPSNNLIHLAIWTQQICVENWGLCPFGEGEPGPHLTQCGHGRGYLHAKFHLHPPAVWPQYINSIDRTGQTDRQDKQDRQRSDNIGRTVLQTVAQKRFILCYRPVLSILSATLVYCGQTVGWIMHAATRYGGRRWFRPHCVNWGPSSPPKGQSPNFRPMSVVAKGLDGSICHLVRR